MTAPVGRREQHKRATRRALEEASQRLFAERGFDGTTVRDIADEAGVTERTFFRYFAGKDELVLEKLLSWLPQFQERIRRRPADEDPLTAFRMAMLASNRTKVGASPMWLFRNGPPAIQGFRSTPLLQLRTEAALAEVFRERLERTGSDAADYQADVAARVAVSVLRSILIRDWQLRDAGVTGRPSLREVVEAAFAVLGR